jgi:ABC-type arginine/histidine transport system permease subunit
VLSQNSETRLVKANFWSLYLIIIRDGPLLLLLSIMTDGGKSSKIVKRPTPLYALYSQRTQAARLSVLFSAAANA